ncbi:MAG: FecR domain-containing protein [Chitinophagales bacterium]
MKTSERIGRLMFRYMRNELTRRETRELMDWRNKSPERENAFQEATDWDNLRADFRELDRNSEAIWEKIKERYPHPWKKKKEEEKKQVPRMHPLLRVAAVLILVLGAVCLYDSNESDKIQPGTYAGSIVLPDGSSAELISDAYHDFIRGFKTGSAGIDLIKHENGEIEYIAKNYPIAARDKMYKLLTYRGNAFILNLPGIARIWINASTNIWIPANLSTDTIRIKMTGEAYFEIADTKHHLIIEIPSTINHQPSTIITDTGSFNIHAYPSDPLKITRDAQSAAWKNGMIFYQDASLKTILDEISRWYNVDVEYKSQGPDKKYHINLPRTAKFSAVIKVLKEQGVQLFVNGRLITVL